MLVFWTRSPKGPMRRPAPFLLMTFVVTVLCSTPVTHVLVYLFPFEGSNDHVKEALKYFGEIKDVKCQQWTNVPGVATGTRIVRMVRRHEIPRNIVIDGVKCRV